MTPFFREVYQLAAPYWRSQERWQARLLLALVIGMNLGIVYITVQLNKWNNDFYNALQAVDRQAFFHALIKFSWLAGSYIVLAVYRQYLNQMLQIRWRRWMSVRYIHDWLTRERYYRMQLTDQGVDNPDQRISEDIQQFIALSLNLTIGMLDAVVTLCSFVVILWSLSGELTVPLGDSFVTVPGYMVWAAALYAAAGTWIMLKLGRPLIRLNFEQQRKEANLRFGLVRLRENSESIAFYRGETQEEAGLTLRLNAVVDNFWRIMRRQKLLNWYTSGYSQIAVIFPFLVAAPRFFAKQIQLGGLMQTVSAFGRVHDALSYIIDAYNSIATWKAVVDRLSGFRDKMETVTTQADAEGPQRVAGGEDALRVEDLTVRLPHGATLIQHLNLELPSGGSLLIAGPSGAGKSTLLRTLAGLWPYAEGRIILSEEARVMFIPQRTYLPLGPLRDAICYPQRVAEVSHDALTETLRACGLAHLEERLEEEGNWSQALSLGEQQRIAFARLLLLAPTHAFLDEASAALDEEMEARLYALVKSRLPRMTLISVGHRSTLTQWHTQLMQLRGAI
ncbi:MAG: ABC transporter ATP-binding protein/permease [Alphaproteobacteria bacterium]|nr:ABC transporter ATP-binding protein/permease [Alphaproteobacteria bacterium]